MTVKSYVSRDSEGRPWPPDHRHEALASMDIVKRLWLAFSHLEDLYSVVVNLHHPSADMVIISQRGIGVVELKHYYGSISQRPDGAWYAGPKRIQAGRRYRNPHKQVQAYAKRIRGSLVYSTRVPPWLPGGLIDRERFKFQTAVCFTHPDVFIEDFKEALRRRYRPDTCPWEEFSVCTPGEMPGWAAALRFEVDRGWELAFEPYRLNPQQIHRIATGLLRGTEWAEIANLMPTGAPYAYLTLIQGGRRAQVFGLDREQVFLGRDANTCGVPVPECYLCVGRVHACITRWMQDVFVEDQGSRNGTYVEGQRVPKGERRRLGHGHTLTLGGPEAGDKVCEFRFSVRTTVAPSSTETHVTRG
jgi:hypothetical protein